MSTFGERLRFLRLENGVSINDLSKSVGVHRYSIYRWERGLTTPKSLEIIALVANFFRVSPEYFFNTVSNADIQSELQQLRAEVNSLRQQIRWLEIN